MSDLRKKFKLPDGVWDAILRSKGLLADLRRQAMQRDAERALLLRIATRGLR